MWQRAETLTVVRFWQPLSQGECPSMRWFWSFAPWQETEDRKCMSACLRKQWCPMFSRDFPGAANFALYPKAAETIGNLHDTFVSSLFLLRWLLNMSVNAKQNTRRTQYSKMLRWLIDTFLATRQSCSITVCLPGGVPSLRSDVPNATLNGGLINMKQTFACDAWKTWQKQEKLLAVFSEHVSLRSDETFFAHRHTHTHTHPTQNVTRMLAQKICFKPTNQVLRSTLVEGRATSLRCTHTNVGKKKLEVAVFADCKRFVQRTG